MSVTVISITLALKKPSALATRVHQFVSQAFDIAEAAL
jgi:hypothetical protein